MFDWLVRRTIFTQADGIMGHDIDGWNAHQSREAHCAAGIIGETHEGATIGANPAVQRHAVHCRSHAMFADAVVDIPPSAIFGIKNPHVRCFCIV